MEALTTIVIAILCGFLWVIIGAFSYSIMSDYYKPKNKMFTFVIFCIIGIFAFFVACVIGLYKDAYNDLY